MSTKNRSTKEVRNRVILRRVRSARKEHRDKLQITVSLTAEIEHAGEFWTHRYHDEKLIRLLRKISRDGSNYRDRSGCVRPYIPRALLAELRTLAAPQPIAEIYKDFLKGLVSLESGERRTDRAGKRKWPNASKEFVARGRQIVRYTDQKDLAHYTFDAGSAVEGIKSLCKSLNLNMSEFFSALTDRICDQLRQGGPSKDEPGARAYAASRPDELRGGNGPDALG